MSDKSWYQVKNIEEDTSPGVSPGARAVRNAEMYHRGRRLKPKQYVYLTEDQAALHNQKDENLAKSEAAPLTVLDCAVEEDFVEYTKTVTSNQSSVISKDISAIDAKKK